MYHCEQCFREITSYEYYANNHLCAYCSRFKYKNLKRLPSNYKFK